MKNRSLRVSLLAVALAVTCGNAFAQAVAGGQIRGIVTDPSGAAIPNAQVTAQQMESGYKRTIASGMDGAYVLPNVPVGPYTVQVSAGGFGTYTQSGIVIQVGDNLAVNVTLKVGAIAEEVQVTAAAPMVETESTAV